MWAWIILIFGGGSVAAAAYNWWISAPNPARTPPGHTGSSPDGCSCGRCRPLNPFARAELDRVGKGDLVDRADQ